MTIESKQEGQAPNTDAPASARERCAGCGATLLEDQRYCLQCGVRRGRPRLDFTAFWKPPSPTSAQATDGPWVARTPPRRVAGVLAAAVLAAGIVAGAALGPTPASSPADSATLAERALTALATQASGGSQAGAAPNPTPAPSASQASPKAAGQKTTISKASSAQASTPSSTESSTPGESGASTPSEGPSPEGSSSKGSGESEKAAPGTPVKLPPIKHVWVIALSGVSFAGALAQAQTDPYLAKQLVPKGTLLNGYKLTAPNPLANGIALLSGQGVNLDTEQDCPTYSALQPPTVNATNGLAEGVGCVYPATVQTLADELTAAGLTWKAYVQGMESGQPGASPQPASAGASCRHPELGAPDPKQAPTPGDPYLTFRNPFVYFHSLLDGGACASDDVDLARLQSDLATPASTPSLSWIAPSACDDGSSAACAPGAPTGLAAADGFLEQVLPQILATAAYRKEGLIAIVPDSPPTSSASAAAKPVGALLLSPFVHRGTHISENLNDFSLLKSLSRLFGVLPLGHANDPSVVSFGATVYGSSGKAAGAASTAKKAAQAAPAAQVGG
jgi:phosphatidylinositol-3-phosphatase